MNKPAIYVNPNIRMIFSKQGDRIIGRSCQVTLAEFNMVQIDQLWYHIVDCITDTLLRIEPDKSREEVAYEL